MPIHFSLMQWLILAAILIACASLVTSTLLEYRWLKAYNAGFIAGKWNDAAHISWAASDYSGNVKLQKAFILGARHAKGY